MTWNFLDNYVQVRSAELQVNSEDIPERPGRQQPRSQRIPLYRLARKAEFKGVLVGQEH